MSVSVYRFEFNPFQENTYVLADPTGLCIIVDPGMVDEEEDQILFDFIGDNNLHVQAILNTHCHIDHILGNASAAGRYNAPLYFHRKELATLERAGAASLMWGVPYRPTPEASKFIDHGDTLRFGQLHLEVRFVPGHAPGHVAFVHHEGALVLGGDVLFRESVGRTDLPGCNAADLKQSILEQLYTLPEHYTVLPGHGPETAIGHEKKYNPFVRP